MEASHALGALCHVIGRVHNPLANQTRTLHPTHKEANRKAMDQDATDLRTSSQGQEKKKIILALDGEPLYHSTMPDSSTSVGFRDLERWNGGTAEGESNQHMETGQGD